MCVVQVLIAAHAAEALFAFYVAAVELKLTHGQASAWAGLIFAIGLPCTRWLLRLRPRGAAVTKSESNSKASKAE